MLELDPYWLEGTKPAWVMTAILYMFSAIYLRSFTSRTIKTRYWGSFFAIGSVIFLLVNKKRLVDSETLILSIEVLAIVLLFFVWFVFFKLVLATSKYQN